MNQRRLSPNQLTVLQKNALRQRGMGQTPGPNLPACASPALAQSVPQMVLIGGGGLATLVGVIGAIVSDDYREDFAIAAGVGLVASFVGGIWAANSLGSLANCVAPPATPPPGPPPANSWLAPPPNNSWYAAPTAD